MSVCPNCGEKLKEPYSVEMFEQLSLVNSQLQIEREALRAQLSQMNHCPQCKVAEGEFHTESCCLLKAQLERDRYREVVAWIASQKDLFFAECTQAEEIIERCKAALGECCVCCPDGNPTKCNNGVKCPQHGEKLE